LSQKKKRQKTFSSPEMTEKFASYPAKTRTNLLSLREMIFEVASKKKEVGEIEVFRWESQAI
jgi:hypothetical protein